MLIKFNDTILVGCIDNVAKDGCASRSCGRAGELLRQSMPVKDIVPKDERNWVFAHEIATDDERVGQSARFVLCGVGNLQTELRTAAKQAFEQRLILWRRNDQDLPNPTEHQGRQRIIYHRLVKHGEQLF